MSDGGKRTHAIKEAIFTLQVGLDELKDGYRFDDKFGEHKIKQIIKARDFAIEELKRLLSEHS